MLKPTFRIVAILLIPCQFFGADISGLKTDPRPLPVLNDSLLTTEALALNPIASIRERFNRSAANLAEALAGRTEAAGPSSAPGAFSQGNWGILLLLMLTRPESWHDTRIMALDVVRHLRVLIEAKMIPPAILDAARMATWPVGWAQADEFLKWLADQPNTFEGPLGAALSHALRLALRRTSFNFNEEEQNSRLLRVMNRLESMGVRPWRIGFKEQDGQRVGILYASMFPGTSQEIHLEIEISSHRQAFQDADNHLGILNLPAPNKPGERRYALMIQDWLLESGTEQLDAALDHEFREVPRRAAGCPAGIAHIRALADAKNLVPLQSYSRITPDPAWRAASSSPAAAHQDPPPGVEDGKTTQKDVDRLMGLLMWSPIVHMDLPARRTGEFQQVAYKRLFNIGQRYSRSSDMQWLAEILKDPEKLGALTSDWDLDQIELIRKLLSETAWRTFTFRRLEIHNGGTTRPDDMPSILGPARRFAIPAPLWEWAYSVPILGPIVHSFVTSRFEGAGKLPITALYWGLNIPLIYSLANNPVDSAAVWISVILWTIWSGLTFALAHRSGKGFKSLWLQGSLFTALTFTPLLTFSHWSAHLPNVLQISATNSDAATLGIGLAVSVVLNILVHEAIVLAKLAGWLPEGWRMPTILEGSVYYDALTARLAVELINDFALYKSASREGMDGHIVSIDGPSGALKTTLANAVQKASQVLGNGHQVWVIDLDALMKEKPYRTAVRSRVIGKPLTEQERAAISDDEFHEIKSGSLYLTEERLWRNDDVEQILKGIREFFDRTGPADEIHTVTLWAWVPEKQFFELQTLPIRRGDTVLVAGKYANLEALSPYYDSRMRLLDNPADVEKRFMDRSDRLLQTEEELQTYWWWYRLALVPSWIAYHERTKAFINGRISLTGQDPEKDDADWSFRNYPANAGRPFSALPRRVTARTLRSGDVPRILRVATLGELVARLCEAVPGLQQEIFTDHETAEPRRLRRWVRFLVEGTGELLDPLNMGPWFALLLSHGRHLVVTPLIQGQYLPAESPAAASKDVPRLNRVERLMGVFSGATGGAVGGYTFHPYAPNLIYMWLSLVLGIGLGVILADRISGPKHENSHLAVIKQIPGLQHARYEREKGGYVLYVGDHRLTPEDLGKHLDRALLAGPLGSFYRFLTAIQIQGLYLFLLASLLTAKRMIEGDVFSPGVYMVQSIFGAFALAQTASYAMHSLADRHVLWREAKKAFLMKSKVERIAMAVSPVLILVMGYEDISMLFRMAPFELHSYLNMLTIPILVILFPGLVQFALKLFRLAPSDFKKPFISIVGLIVLLAQSLLPAPPPSTEPHILSTAA